MIDVLVLGVLTAAAAAAGLALLRALRALPADAADHLLAGAAAGLGLAGASGLLLAALGVLRPWAIVGLGLAALAMGGPALAPAVRAAWPRVDRAPRAVLALCALVLAAAAVTMFAPPVGGDQTKYQLVYPRLYAAAGGLVPTPWSFWGQMQYLQNFVFALAFALRGDVLARLLNGTFGVLATLALTSLARRHFGRGSGVAVGVIFFTLPITWSLMTRAGSDLPVILYTALALSAVLDWRTSRATGDVVRAGLMAGFAAGCKVMALLTPALVGTALLVLLARTSVRTGSALRTALIFGVVALAAMSPWPVRNAVETGNPIYPFGYGLFGGRHWSAEAGAYLDDYYRTYQTTWAARREATAPYQGLQLVRFPWDVTMHPESFEKGARQSLDVGPFALAFAPAVLLLARGTAPRLVGAVGLAYFAVIAAAAWPHPRYVLPGIVLLLAASVPAVSRLVGRRWVAVVVAITVAVNLGVTAGLLRPMWPDQLRVATGRMTSAAFLRKYSDRWVFWERANQAIPVGARVLVLEKIPHPYYIEHPYVLASYLEQDLVDYRTLDTPDALAGAARLLGVSYVAVDMAGLDAAGDPFEARVAALWRAFLAEQCEVVLRAGGFGLYAIRTPTGLAWGEGGGRG